MKLVPCEPTEEMIAEGKAYLPTKLCDMFVNGIYKAMLEAAPAAPDLTADPVLVEKFKLENLTMVICPNCVHQFRAIPEDVQDRLAQLEKELASSMYWEKFARSLNDEAREKLTAC